MIFLPLYTYRGIFHSIVLTQDNHKLPSSQRLKSRKQIELLFEKGKSFSHYNLRITYLNQPDGIGIQAAFSAPKRNFKRAVDRNRIKRMMKEVYRKQKLLIESKRTTGDLIFLINYIGKELPNYQALYESMTCLLQKLREKID